MPLVTIFSDLYKGILFKFHVKHLKMTPIFWIFHILARK